MNPRIENLRGYILRKEHHVLRRTPARLGLDNLNIGFAAAGMPPVRRSAEMLAALMRAEQPVILPGEKIVFTRTVTEVPEIFTPQEWDGIKASHYIHERGTVCNISPDYETTIRLGLDARKAEIASRLADDSLDQEQRIFLGSVALCIEAVQELTGRYAAHAREAGQADTAQVLEAVRTRGARSLREALQLLRILHFAIWEAGNYHNTLGRFDQYMYPYFRHDIDSGVLTEEEAFDLVEEFFLACNKDSDLYPGMQQGDNGQSMVLGGRAANGDYLFNRLSEMCLRASCELELIDPKINIRVDADTPDEIFFLGSQLTRKGLGFPQYSNDDVIVPGLMKKGYSEQDARNYVVAACWEFIIPNHAMDIPNIDAVSLIGCVREVLPELEQCPDYAAFYGRVERKIAEKADAICRKHRNLYIAPAPMMSLLMDGTIERAQDISLGSRYNNYGRTARALPRRPTRWRRCANSTSRSAVSMPRRCSRRWRTTSAAHPNYNACCGGRLPRWGRTTTMPIPSGATCSHRSHVRSKGAATSGAASTAPAPVRPCTMFFMPQASVPRPTAVVPGR